MVTDNRSAGPWQPAEYEGCDPLPIVNVKVHLRRDALAREKWPPKKLRGCIDGALWDIAGKRHGLPVWRFAGACRDVQPGARYG